APTPLTVLADTGGSAASRSVFSNFLNRAVAASVTTRGNGSGPFFSHQSRYSAANQQLHLAQEGASQTSLFSSGWVAGSASRAGPPPKGGGGSRSMLPGRIPPSGDRGMP